MGMEAPPVARPLTKVARRRPQRRRWRQDPGGRRERLLEAASSHFSARGYQRARVSEIARTARASEGTVYHLFGSKRALLVAVGERYGEGLAAAAFEEPGAAVTGKEVGRIVSRIFAYVRASDGPLRAFLLANEPDEGQPAQAANRVRMLQAIESALRAGLDSGQLPPLDPRVTAELQFGLVEAALRACFIDRKGAGESLYVRETTRILRASLSPGG